MCGIAGFLDPRRTLDTAEAKQRLKAMGDAIAHRGPDADAQWVEGGSEGGVWLGLAHRRLSIVDLTPTGAQPMSSHCGRFTISYNGEIYNHADLRAGLDAQGTVPWRGTSDTEVLLTLIARHGVRGAIDLCDGMFALAVFDRETGCLTLARDAFGEKPLYYGLWRGKLLFASELTALCAWPGFDPDEDSAALGDYFAYSCIPAPRTIYKGIHKLPPGHLIEITGDAVAAAQLPVPLQWFDPIAAALTARNNLFDGSFEQAVEATRSVLTQAVMRRQVADVPLGALLSGGVDSSLTAALMQSVSDRPIRTFTIGFEDPAYDESPYAEAVARHLGTQHQTQILTAQAVRDVIPYLAAHCDEPFADSSLVPTYLVSRMAGQHVKVVLSGDGGDELFGGYNRYLFGPRLWSRVSGLPGPLRRGLGQGLGAVPPAALTIFFNALPNRLSSHLGWGRAGEQLHKVARLLRSRNQLDFHDRLLRTTDRCDVLKDPGAGHAVTDDMDPRLLDLPFAEALMVYDLCHYLPNDVLSKVDRASMASSLEARTPFLNRAVMNLAWSLPMGHKIHGSTGKRVLRALLDAHVPPSLMDRPKAGFALPIGRWLRGPLSSWAADLLSGDSLSAADKLDSDMVQRLWGEHKSGRCDHESLIWSLLMYLSWRKRAT
jgi:asparagine synthase (glutamine-hydrolysing)